MNIFVATLPVLMGCYGNHSFQITKWILLRNIVFLPFVCLIEPFGIKRNTPRNLMQVLLTLRVLVYAMVLSSFLSFH